MADARYVVGLDLGQVSDWTALAVLERPPYAPGPTGAPATYALRHLERLPLGTAYPDVVRATGDLLLRLPPNTTRLVADATGVGRPVVDLLREARLRPVPVVVHGGAESTVDDHGYRRVPKRDLVGVTQVLLQQGRLKLAASLPLVPVFREELTNFRLKITAAGNDTYEAWREGQHDDLVFVVCLAAWYAEGEAQTVDWLTGHPTGTLTRRTPSRADRQAAATRAFFGRGVDPRAGPRVGRNGYVPAGTP